MFRRQFDTEHHLIIHKIISTTFFTYEFSLGSVICLEDKSSLFSSFLNLPIHCQVDSSSSLHRLQYRTYRQPASRSRGKLPAAGENLYVSRRKAAIVFGYTCHEKKQIILDTDMPKPRIEGMCRYTHTITSNRTTRSRCFELL